MKIQGNESKPGMIIDFNNDHWVVLKAQHVKPGKGGAFNQLELKSLTKGTKLNQRFRSNGSKCFFMEPKTFEQISIDESMLGEKSKLLTENLEVTISFLEEKPLTIDLPNNIECEIDSTEGVVKGQTAASSYKPAKLKNGINIMVPPFIEQEDKIIIDTRTLEYVKKVT